jgi:UDP-glucose 4-epimerase
MANIIVIGCAGFIGSNLTLKLVELGHRVTGVDNLSYGNLNNIKSLKNNKLFNFFENDARDFTSIQNHKGDIVIHLASQKIPRYSSAFCTLEDNSLMLKNVLRKCNEDKIKIVYASTSDVYGKNPNLPYHEESDLVLGPTTVKRWAYALSKIYGEQLIIANNAEFGLEYTITRFFGSYGPNQNTTWWGGPQAVFIQNILEGKQLEVHGDGAQTRTFTYVDDTVDGIVKCTFETNAKNEIFNVANNPTEEVTIIELAKIISKLMKEDSKADIKMIPYETFGKYEDVRRRVPSIDKIKKLLNYQPKVSLVEGLKKTIAWQRGILNS